MTLISGRKIIFVVYIGCFFLDVCESQNKESKLKDTLRNTTNSKDNQNNGKNGEQNDDEDQNNNALKSEAEKYLKQCGAEKRNSNNDNNEGYNNNYRNGNNRNGYNRNGQSSSSGGFGSDYYGNSRNSNNNNNNRNNNKYNRYGQYGQEEDDNEGSNSNNDDGEWNSYSSSKWNENQNSGSNNGYSNTNNNNNNRQSDYGNRQQSYGQTNSDSNRYGTSSNNRNQNGYSNSRYGGILGNSNGNDRTNNGYGGSSFNKNSQDESSSGSSNYDQSGYGFLSPTRGYQGSSTNYDVRRSYSPSRGYNRGGAPNEDCPDSDDRGYGSNMFGYNTGMTFGLNTPQPRQKRFNYFNRDENSKNDNNQCVSQCVFGYLHLLDDDRTPSETMLIKWLQEHVAGNDMDRIKALRDARRCFARLTTSDLDDGCEFSTELSKCLDLDLE